MQRIFLLLVMLGGIGFAEEGDLIWRYKVGSPIASSPAIGSDGTIYVGVDGGYLYAVKPDGDPRWFYATLGWKSVHSSPAIAQDGTIYFGGGDGYVYAFDENGNRLWMYKTGAAIYSSPAISSNGTIYIGSDGLYAFWPNGTLKWRYKTASQVNSSPAVGPDGSIYFGCLDSYLYALEPDGNLLWRYQAESYIYSSPGIGSDGTIYFASVEGYLYALNPDAALKWKYLLRESDSNHITWILSSPSIGPDGTVYIGTAEETIYQDDYWVDYGYLYALNPDGTLRWRYRTEEIIESSPTVGADGLIYFGAGGSTWSSDPDSCFLYVLNPDGSLHWRYHIPKGVRSSPTIIANGTLYVGADDEYLYAIETSSAGLASSSWPKFRHDIRNTGRADQPDLFANFSAQPRGGCMPLAVQFTDESVGNPTTWHWLFGDGEESFEQNPIHTYDSVSAYTVTLEVSNASQSDTKTKTDYITVRTTPQAEFTADTTEGCPPLTVHFTDQSSGYPESWKWNFGDYSSSKKQNPVHIYGPGYYTVTLIVSNVCSSDTITKVDYIHVYSPEIGAAPSWLSTEIGRGMKDTLMLRISNLGTCSSFFEIYKKSEHDYMEWISCNPWSDVIEPAAHKDVEVIFDASNQDTGIYTGTLMIISDDESRDPLSVPCTLKVTRTAIGEDKALPAAFFLGEVQLTGLGGVTIQYGLPKATKVNISLYDLNGRLVKTLFEGRMPAGYHNARWDGYDSKGQRLSRGLYFCRMRTPEFTATRKIVILELSMNRVKSPEEEDLFQAVWSGGGE